MNWSQGLLRLWLIFAVAWILFWGRMAFDPQINCFLRSDCSDIGRTDFLDYAIVFGGPMLVLAIGSAILWAVAGFREQ